MPDTKVLLATITGGDRRVTCWWVHRDTYLLEVDAILPPEEVVREVIARLGAQTLGINLLGGTVRFMLMTPGMAIDQIRVEQAARHLLRRGYGLQPSERKWF